ncbi:MAG TPA: hypothetical protein VL096_17145 [Pirellulaceae bacterium]|nr:hypothetical protein [Pirellulaceae bacterium]
MIRSSLGFLAVSVVSFATLGFTLAQVPSAPAKPSGQHAAMMSCAKACSDCQRACDMCTTHCANQLESGKKEHLATLRSCQDCAAICATASQVVARGGPMSSVICKACAEACAACAKQCETMPDDEHMKACAKECRACEKECRAMLEHAEHVK